jgi:hypothetical protein
MLLRFVLCGLAVCGLVGVELSSFAEAAGRSVHRGKTAQGYPLRLAMQGEQSLTLLRFKADLNCRDGSVLQLEESGFLPTRIRGNGSFRDTQFGKTDTVRFRGKVTAAAVRGQVRLEDRFGSKRIRCSSKWIKFNVKR